MESTELQVLMHKEYIEPSSSALGFMLPLSNTPCSISFFYQHNRDCMIKKTDEAGEEDFRCLIRNIKNMLESSWRNSSLCSCEREFYYMFLFGEINESTLSFLPTVWFHFNLVHTINANSKYYSHTGQVSLSVSTLSHYGALKYIKFNKIIALWERDWIFLVTRKYSLLEIDTFLLD